MADTANALSSTATIAASQVNGKVASASAADSANALAPSATVGGGQVSGALTNSSIGGDKITGNLNITGNGTLSGSLSAGTVNATTQFNLGGTRVLSGGWLLQLLRWPCRRH